jgi:hypothetical protein
VEERRPITEEDLRVTEALIAESYGRLKRAVMQAPANAVGCVGTTIREHPLESIAAMAGAGLAAYGLLRWITPRAAPKGREGEKGGRSDWKGEIISKVLPMVVPYLLEYLKESLRGSRSSGE